MSLPNDVLEEIASRIEKDTSSFLRERLPPRVDFNVSVSIIRDESGVDVIVDVSIRGRLEHYSVEAKDAINYAKKRLLEILEEFSKQTK